MTATQMDQLNRAWRRWRARNGTFGRLSARRLAEAMATIKTFGEVLVPTPPRCRSVVVPVVLTESKPNAELVRDYAHLGPGALQ